MKNVLVTGDAGYIGSHIIEQLIKKGLKVFKNLLVYLTFIDDFNISSIFMII